MEANDLFGLFDESARIGELKAAAQQEITAAIERRFCLTVCMAIVGAERGAMLVNRVCDQALEEADTVIGGDVVETLFGADFLRGIVEQHRATLLEALQK